MRKLVVAMVALALPFVGAGPASADPARASAAAAFGLQATGTVPLGPLAPSAAVFPGGPADQTGSDSANEVLEVPLGTLALAGVVGSISNAHLNDDITPQLAAAPALPGISEPVTIPGGANARGLAKTTGVGLVFTAPAGTVVDPIATALAELTNAAGGLLGADAITAEAVAKCVNNTPVFETGFEIVELGGLAGGLLNDTVQQTLDTVLDLLEGGGGDGGGQTGLLSSIISVQRGRVTQIPNGVAIDGLVVSIPLLNEEIIISHAEAAMPANCAVEPPAEQPTGPGDIAPTLAATGSSALMLQAALGLLAAGVGLRRLNRRARRTGA
jgi:hypothetical protein